MRYPGQGKLRLVLAVLALACFCLPLGQCSYNTYEKPPAVVKPGVPLALGQATTRTSEFIPAAVLTHEPKDFGDLLGSMAIVLAFIWPAIAVATRARIRSETAVVLLATVEALASLGSLYLLSQWFLVWSKILMAGYVAALTFLAWFAVAATTIARGTWRLLSRA